MREMENATKNVEWIVENDIATDKYCIYCGARIGQATAYCTNCGQNQTPEAVQPQTQNYQQQQYYGQQPTYNQGYGQPQTYQSSRRAMKHKPKKDRTARNKIVAGVAIFSLIAIILLWPPMPPTPTVEKYAIVVGVSDYIEYDGDDDLRYADDDGKDWADYLEGQGYKVYKLIDHDATKNKIREAIELVKEREGREDYVAFIFSGHGFSNKGHSYLGAADSLPDSYKKDIRDTELANWFEDFDSEHIFIFLASCRSGGFDEVSGPGRYVAQACGEKGVGWEFRKYGNDVWTHWFLEQGLMTGDYTNLETVFENVKDEVYEDYWYAYNEKKEDYELAVALGMMTEEEMEEALERIYPTMPEQEDGDPDSSFKL